METRTTMSKGEDAPARVICCYCRKAIEIRRGSWVHIDTSSLTCNPVFTESNWASSRATPLSMPSERDLPAAGHGPAVLTPVASAPDELFDDDGDPTDEALDYLRTFIGTAGDMVAYVQSLMHRGLAVVDYFTNDFGRPEKRLTLITGGWSGCEAVVGALHDNMFWVLFWESSFRGGKHTFSISAAQWDMHLAWGIPTAASTGQTPKD